MAITDLTGYTWQGNDTLEGLAVTYDLDFNINFTSNSNSYTNISFVLSNPVFQVNYGNSNVYYHKGGWADSNYKTIQITGGEDATNSDLIAWLEVNGTLTPPAPSIADKLLTVNQIKQDIKVAIENKDVDMTGVDFGGYAGKIDEIQTGGGLPSTGSQGIFTGATVPLTYKDNTHDYENNYEYKSGSHNITITGLEGRATITGNGTNNVLVQFDVSSATTSLKNFTITCANGDQSLVYKGLHAHYGTTVTGILTFAYINITKDGSEGTIGTNYKFIVTGATTLPIFSEETTLWNTIYSYQVLNTLIGNYSSTSIGGYFLRYCYSFNQPLTLPSNLTSIGSAFLQGCYSFNQPLTLPSNLTSIGNHLLSFCYSFNQPLAIPSNLTSIGESFLWSCYSFNQPLTIPNGVTSIVSYFLWGCYSFNQPLTLPSNLTSIGSAFLQGCYSFNQPLTLPSNLTSIGLAFLQGCYSFNQPLAIPSNLTSIGDSFLRDCYSFNQPLAIPSNLTSIGDSFLRDCYSLSTLIYDASVYPTDALSLYQGVNTKTSTDGAGIIIYGSKRAGLMSALPNKTSRKLINGGS